MVVITESWITEKREVSSAKSLVLEDKPSAKSLIYIENNNGPRMKPWGTPALTLVHEDHCPFNTILCFLFVKKCFKTFNKLPDIQFSCNIKIRPSKNVPNLTTLYLLRDDMTVKKLMVTIHQQSVTYFCK